MDNKNIQVSMYLIAWLVTCSVITSAITNVQADAFQLVEKALIALGSLATGIAIERVRKKDKHNPTGG